MWGFLNANNAKSEWLIPNKNNIVWFPWLWVYVSEDWGAALCSFVDDWNLWVLNIYELSEWVKITCGHILSDWNCGYRLWKDWEAIKCPLLKLNSVIIENPNIEIKAA